MTDKSEELDVMFYQLILSMQASAMQYLGKVMNQITGKIERNLEAARLNIDMLEMVQRKTEGNLSEQEKKLLDHVLYELRINYVDEQGKGEDTDETDAAPEATAEGAEQPSEGDETGAADENPEDSGEKTG
jgi:hypothetical protein